MNNGAWYLSPGEDLVKQGAYSYLSSVNVEGGAEICTIVFF